RGALRRGRRRTGARTLDRTDRGDDRGKNEQQRRKEQHFFHRLPSPSNSIAVASTLSAAGSTPAGREQSTLSAAASTAVGREQTAAAPPSHGESAAESVDHQKKAPPAGRAEECP